MEANGKISVTPADGELEHRFQNKFKTAAKTVQAQVRQVCCVTSTVLDPCFEIALSLADIVRPSIGSLHDTCIAQVHTVNFMRTEARKTMLSPERTQSFRRREIHVQQVMFCCRRILEAARQP